MAVHPVVKGFPALIAPVDLFGAAAAAAAHMPKTVGGLYTAPLGVVVGVLLVALLVGMAASAIRLQRAVVWLVLRLTILVLRAGQAQSQAQAVAAAVAVAVLREYREMGELAVFPAVALAAGAVHTIQAPDRVEQVAQGKSKRGELHDASTRFCFFKWITQNWVNATLYVA